MALLEVQHLKKIYSTRFGAQQVQALSDLTFSVESGEFVAIMGESGSGKTTLLNILSMLDKPTEGKVQLNGRTVSEFRDREIAEFRRNHLGYVYQEFNLLDTLNVEDNILLPLVLAEVPYPALCKKLKPVAETLRLVPLLKKQPYELSGGERQRVAIARALIIDPDLILADEPTGSLDSNASDQLMQYFESIHRAGQTLLMVTHSTRAASFAERVLFIRDGRIFHQLYRADRTQAEMYEQIANTLTILAKEAAQ